MTTTTLEPERAGRRVSPAAAWSPAARYGAAGAMTVGALLWVFGDLYHRGGGPPGSSLQWTAAHPTAAGLELCADLLGSTLLVVTLPVWLLLGLPGSRRLAWAGAIFGVFGMAGQLVIHGVEIAAYIVALDGHVDLVAFDRALNSDLSGPPLVLFMVMFLGGNFLGAIPTQIALWRARTLPIGSLLLWVVFLLLNILDVKVPTTPVAAAALIWMAVAIVRAPAARLP